MRAGELPQSTDRSNLMRQTNIPHSAVLPASAAAAMETQQSAQR